MKKVMITTVFICLIIMLQSCTTNTNTTNVAEYGHWDSSIEKVLSNNFSDSLPDKEAVQKYGMSYYCDSKQGLLGDENIVVYVTLQFQNVAEYEGERNKYKDLLSNYVLNNETTFYTIQYSYENVLEYANSEILDGMYYNFEIIAANDAEYTISFVNAQVWDYHKDQVLLDFLQNMGQGDGSVVPFPKTQ